MAIKPKLKRVEKFLYHEARLLDEQRWEEWQALFVDEGEYWVPATPGQPDPLNHVSIMYERSLLRAVRIKRYSHPNALSLQPVPRTTHAVSNIMIDDVDRDGQRCVVNSRLVMLEYRREQQNVYGAAVTHTLDCSGEDFLIIRKKVELNNCEAALTSIQVYF